MKKLFLFTTLAGLLPIIVSCASPPQISVAPEEMQKTAEFSGDSNLVSATFQNGEQASSRLCADSQKIWFCGPHAAKLNGGTGDLTIALNITGSDANEITFNVVKTFSEKSWPLGPRVVWITDITADKIIVKGQSKSKIGKGVWTLTLTRIPGKNNSFKAHLAGIPPKQFSGYIGIFKRI